jgi:hypothetical protein
MEKEVGETGGRKMEVLQKQTAPGPIGPGRGSDSFQQKQEQN